MVVQLECVLLWILAFAGHASNTELQASIGTKFPKTALDMNTVTFSCLQDGSSDSITRAADMHIELTSA